MKISLFYAIFNITMIYEEIGINDTIQLNKI